MTDLPATLLQRLDEAFSAARDPDRAAGMAAYMRAQFPYVGLPAPRLRALERGVWAGLPPPTEPELQAVAEECWSRPEREWQYFACDYLLKHQSVPGPDFLKVTAGMITTKSWWDTVDALATRCTGGLVRRHPSLIPTMDAWSRDDNMWLVRAAILHQLHYGAETDTDRLFGYCLHQAGHPDFFVRKAIGWALRHYARTDPDAVRRFLAAHRDVLSPLSAREAGKHL